jgi:hypothetical protein
VDVAQLVELQRRLVGEDTSRPARPKRRLHVWIEPARRREREAVQARPAAVRVRASSGASRLELATSWVRSELAKSRLPR